VTVALLGFGLVMVWSASSALAQERHGSPYYFLLKQVAWGVLGLAGMVAALRLDYRTLRRPAVVYSLLIASTVLLIGVLFLSPVNETHRWIRMGALSFQPAELAKLSMVLFLAYHVERRAERVNELVTLFPALLLLGWFGFLILIQPDLGTAFCLVLTGAVMLYVAGVRLKYFAVLAIPAVVVLYAAVMTVPWRRVRVTSFINPWSDPQGAGYQVIQSLIAVGTGGVTGVGVMEGRQKLFYLPYPYSDFIFAVIGEELGMLGALAVVLAFVHLWHGLRPWGAHEFSRFLAAGPPCRSSSRRSSTFSHSAPPRASLLHQRWAQVLRFGHRPHATCRSTGTDVAPTILIAAGGTGGHLFPGIAVADELVRRDAATRVVFAGTPKGLESRLVPRAGYALELLPILPLNGVGIVRMLKGLAALPWGLVRSAALVRRLRPAAVLGIGGYAGGPVTLLAALLGVRAVILEPNAKPGFTNRVLKPFARAAACAYEEARGAFGAKGVLTGTPVRGGFAALNPREHREPLTLLAFGGSQGSRVLNRALVEALPRLPGNDRLLIVHQTGPAMRDEVEAAYRAAGREAEVPSFLDDMERRFGEADLAVPKRGHDLRGARRGGQGGDPGAVRARRRRPPADQCPGPRGSGRRGRARGEGPLRRDPRGRGARARGRSRDDPGDGGGGSAALPPGRGRPRGGPPAPRGGDACLGRSSASTSWGSAAPA
jgi:cell division protein FtsW